MIEEHYQTFVEDEVVSSPLSQKSAISGGIHGEHVYAGAELDPISRYWHTAPYATNNSRTKNLLRLTQDLFEWSYGYRAPGTELQRFTRRAPSAGAMYPTELFIYLPPSRSVESKNNQGTFLIYSFENHCFFPVDSKTAAPQSWRELDPAAQDNFTCKIIVSSFFWRTVRRYGVRGYRYSLLDASAVISHLAKLMQLQGLSLKIAEDWCARSLSAALELGKNEGIVTVFNLTSDASFQPKLSTAPYPDFIPHSIAPSVEIHPRLSEMLEKVSNFHIDAAETMLTTKCNQLANFINLLSVSNNNTPFCSLLQERYSASRFNREPIALDTLRNILRTTATLLQLENNQAVPLAIYFLIQHTYEAAPGIYRLNIDATNTPQFQLVKSASLMAELQQACQGQHIVGNASVASIICANKLALSSANSAVYRETVLRAGLLDIELQHQATMLNVDNTCIGGFEDSKVAQVVGNSALTPIVIHLFGMGSQGNKADALGTAMCESQTW